MKHDKPEFNSYLQLPQKDIDHQDEILRRAVRDGLADIAISDEGDLVFYLTDMGKQLNGLHPDNR